MKLCKHNFWICLCDKSTVSQDLSYVTAWIPGGDSKTCQVQNRGDDCDSLPNSKRLSSLLVLKAAAYSAVSQKCLNFRNMEKRTKFIMQNSSLYLFHELLRIFKCVYVCHTVAQYFIAEVDKGLSCNCSWKLRRAAAFPALIYDSIQKRNKTLSAVVSVLATKRVGQLNLPWCSWYLLVQNPERSRLSSLKQLVKPDLSLFIQNRFTRSLYNQRLGGKKKKTSLTALFCSLKSCHEQPS